VLFQQCLIDVFDFLKKLFFSNNCPWSLSVRSHCQRQTKWINIYDVGNMFGGWHTERETCLEGHILSSTPEDVCVCVCTLLFPFFEILWRLYPSKVHQILHKVREIERERVSTGDARANEWLGGKRQKKTVPKTAQQQIWHTRR